MNRSSRIGQVSGQRSHSYQVFVEIQTQGVLPQTLPKLLPPCEKSTTVRADLHRWISGWKTTVFQGSFVWDWALFLPWWYAVLSCFLFVMLWIVACQAPLSMGFSRQEYWSGLTCPPPGNLPDPGIEFMSLLFPALAGGDSLTTNASWKAHDGRKHKLWTLINQNVILLKRIPGRKKKRIQALLWWPNVTKTPASAGGMGLIPDPGRSHMLWSS